MLVNLAESTAAEHTRPQCRDGRLESDFEVVYREHADGIYRFCLAQLGDPAAAEDCAAEAFAAALAAIRRVGNAPADVAPWMFRIARNTSIDWIRRERVRGRFLGRRHDAETADVETVAEIRSELQAALRAISHLGKRDRVLVGLRAAAGLTYAEIASVLGMKENAARMATTRALTRVRMEVLRDE
jgi:RNA polymerase sigma-70 factor, ECF subfamily